MRFLNRSFVPIPELLIFGIFNYQFKNFAKISNLRFSRLLRCFLLRVSRPLLLRISRPLSRYGNFNLKGYQKLFFYFLRNWTWSLEKIKQRLFDQKRPSLCERMNYSVLVIRYTLFNFRFPLDKGPLFSKFMPQVSIPGMDFGLVNQSATFFTLNKPISLSLPGKSWLFLSWASPFSVALVENKLYWAFITNCQI